MHPRTATCHLAFASMPLSPAISLPGTSCHCVPGPRSSHGPGSRPRAASRRCGVSHWARASAGLIVTAKALLGKGRRISYRCLWEFRIRRCEHAATQLIVAFHPARRSRRFSRLAALLVDEVVHTSVIDDIERKFGIRGRSHVDAFSMKFLLVRLAGSRRTASDLADTGSAPRGTAVLQFEVLTFMRYSGLRHSRPSLSRYDTQWVFGNERCPPNDDSARQTCFLVRRQDIAAPLLDSARTSTRQTDKGSSVLRLSAHRAATRHPVDVRISRIR